MFHHLLGQLVGTGLVGGFAVDAYNGLGVALAEMHPAVGKVNLDTVDGGHRARGISLVERRHLAQQGVDAEILNVHTIKPIDRETILASAKKTVLSPLPEDVSGFDAYMKEFRLALGVERAAVETN